MGSFRRNLSVAPRDGSGEVVSGSSSPKLPQTQNYFPNGGVFAAFFGTVDGVMALRRIGTAILGYFLKRYSRPTEKPSKLKGHTWRRALFHLFASFMLGLFIGFTPFISPDLAVNFVSKHQAFSFEAHQLYGDGHGYINVSRYTGFLTNTEEFKRNASLEGDPTKQLRDDTSVSFPLLSTMNDSDFVYRKLLIIVTPTYNRPFQAYYLNRLAHTLRLVPRPLLWIVVEMSSQSPETAEILRKTGVMYRHLVCQTNTTMIDRSVHQRNVALAHIEKHHLNGIVYFADDHNIYSIDLFEQLREIRRFGTWPVALLMESMNKAVMEGPVCNGSQVIGWHTNERSKEIRRFPIHMLGFAFNSTILWEPKLFHRPTLEYIRQLDTAKGLQGTAFIEQLVEDESQMEGLPINCSRIMVWHLHLEASQFFYPQQWTMKKDLDVVASPDIMIKPTISRQSN